MNKGARSGEIGWGRVVVSVPGSVNDTKKKGGLEIGTSPLYGGEVDFQIQSGEGR